MPEILRGEPTKEVLGSVNVAELNVYLIKSCGATRLTHADVGPRGMVDDREYMVVDAQFGEFRTQREDKALALVRPLLGGAGLVLAAPGMQDLTVPVLREGDIRKSIVWRDTVDGVDQGNEAAQWFSEYLKKDSRLVRMADNFVRQVDQRYARENDQVGFADGFPFLLTSTDSLAELNRRIISAHPEERSIPMNRFRPNIVITGTGIPFIEDTWTEIQIGEMFFQVAKPCARCPIPTTDQETAVRGKEPMRTLLSFRPKNNEGFPYFGQNLIHRSEGWLSVWDPVFSATS